MRMHLAITAMTAAIAMTGAYSDALVVLSGVFLMVAASGLMMKAATFFGLGPIGSVLLGLTAVYLMYKGLFALRDAGQSMLKSPDAVSVQGQSQYSTDINYDSGGMYTGSRMYDMGGPTTEHGMAVLQKGETVIPKTRNMLDSGITLNIGGDIVTDNAEDFAERIAQVLPEALRRQNDIGGI